MSQFLLRQIQDIQQGGLPVLKRKLGRILLLGHKALLHSVNGIWAIPAVLLIRALRPWVLFRIGTLTVIRIGHFVEEAAEHKARLKEQPPKTVDWFWLPRQTCNQQWEQMVRRELPVYQWTKYLSAWNSLLSRKGKAHERPTSYTQSRDITGLYQRHDVKFAFTEVETVDAKKWLLANGWKEGKPFVCVSVRDDAYLANHKLHGRGDDISYKDWSYHDYRNSNIATYVPALEWLAEQGVWVLRMGKVMQRRLKSNHPRIIDYAFCEDKSDLLDIWLFANCNFCISTGTGIDSVCVIYRRPILYLNVSPLAHFGSYSQSTWVPKSMYWAKSGKPLRLHEYLVHSYLKSEEYRRVGLELRDLKTEKILTYTQEFWQRLQGTWQETEEDLELHLRFWEILESWEDYSKLHGWRHPESRVATMWLRQQSEGFFD